MKYTPGALIATALVPLVRPVANTTPLLDSRVNTAPAIGVSEGSVVEALMNDTGIVTNDDSVDTVGSEVATAFEGVNVRLSPQA
jgi:hypothetical protein